MFWSQMNLVHHLPINPEIGKDESLWWTPEEKKVLELISHQISYGRFGDDVPDLPILTDELGMTKEHLDYYKYHCLGPVVLCEEGKLVLGLDPLWQNFFTKHTDIGKYRGKYKHELVHDLVLVSKSINLYNAFAEYPGYGLGKGRTQWLEKWQIDKDWMSAPRQFELNNMIQECLVHNEP